MTKPNFLDPAWWESQGIKPVVIDPSKPSEDNTKKITDAVKDAVKQVEKERKDADAI